MAKEKVTAAVIEPILDEEGIPDFLKRPFKNEGEHKLRDENDFVHTQRHQPELSAAEEFRAKNPYTPRDLEVIAQLEKERGFAAQASNEAEKAAKQSKRDAEKAEQERLRQIRINLRRQQGVPKQEWDE